MILKTITLERFKAAFRPDPISLQPFNVLIGRNGSGKSTLLEALQWIDVTVRQDARVACDRYYGVQDLVNLRSRTQTPYFRLGLEWQSTREALEYQVQVEARESLPVITEEQLTRSHIDHMTPLNIITTIRGKGRALSVPNQGGFGIFRGMNDSDRLALKLAMSLEDMQLEPLEQFWSNTAFLRLSPNRLANGSSPMRKSFEPMLDEEGQTLPALLYELNEEQRKELALQLEEIMPGIRGLELSEANTERDTKIHYSLLERMPYKGRTGHTQFPIPAWMLSEGTRRITAILALLLHDPLPSLLCIEEIENGLDPWTVRYILRQLQSAADRGVQVIVTTHSPWLLDHVPMDSILQVRRMEGDTRYERFRERPEIQAFHPDIPAGTRYIHGENP